MRNLIYMTVKLIMEYVSAIRSVKRDYMILQKKFEDTVNKE